MSSSSTRRLPGIRFEAQPPSAPDELPRMDVAAFVGFAASGPLDHPVLVEDVARFQAIFGQDLPIAWDKERGETVHAYLAPAVRAFFRNGGRRCWVVRVAGRGASYNRFLIPGLLRLVPSGPEQTTPRGHLPPFAPAYARARSEGSWSDPLLISASLSAEPLTLLGRTTMPARTGLRLASSAEPARGDLLRVRFETTAYTLLLPVEQVEKEEEGWWVHEISPQWLRSGVSPEPPPEVTSPEDEWTLTLLWMGDDAGLDTRLLTATVKQKDTSTLELETELPLTAAPGPGALLCTQDEERLWFIVRNVRPKKEGLTVTGEWVELMPSAPSPDELLSLRGGMCERLTFGLWVRRGAESPTRLEGLGFWSRHPRYWGALPTDLAWIQRAAQEGPSLAYTEPELHDELRRSASEPRFPLAGSRDEDDSFYFPLAMAALPEPYLGRVQTSEHALVRDGLERLRDIPFVDEAMLGGPLAMLAQAHFIQYQSPQPRALKGIHSLLSKEEVTLVAVPDAVHRPWNDNLEKKAPRAAPPALAPPAPAPDNVQGDFQDCVHPEVPLAGHLSASPSSPVLGESFELSWSTPKGKQEPVLYTLEEATREDFENALVLHQGPAERMTLFAQKTGTYHYRVRASRGGLLGPWSQTLDVSIGDRPGYTLSSAEHYGGHQEHLVTLHHALMTMCAARGDLLAVLSLPEHFREDEAIGHAELLRRYSPFQGASSPLRPGVNILSHGALYHPWLLVSEVEAPGAPRRMPPDGAACGVLARRANERGAWVTPANEPWRDVVALSPRLERQRWPELLDAQVNSLVQEPRGFVSLTASTLTEEPDLVPIHVRRTLALLRRAALRLGTTYVFENNTPVLHRSVQRGFEQLLSRLLTQGAFAGATREDSFQVVIPSGPDTGSGQGRFLVELRVALSSPLTFLNIRLVQHEDRSLFTQES
ncbi:hypothetical protein [Archangium violaceum]|uniref:Tail sheath protein C-terminal domain-containing protein n=1 Tax=Archangium violaceum Cb vi76 TaxID=1406225 RepID=A0A084T0U9_9BACT|nr:hypothetical protein [Archangium violaceum]KFA94334.1 hypothetical protein Q664_03305 [Archangium violaceum Cb vi76]